jgi:hypothetical protein
MDLQMAEWEQLRNSSMVRINKKNKYSDLLARKRLKISITQTASRYRLNIRGLMSIHFNQAMQWELLEFERNPRVRFLLYGLGSEEWLKDPG